MTGRPRLPERISGCLFDLDGVITRTAGVHAAAWKQTFDGFLARHRGHDTAAARPFDADLDYAAYVDGRPRADGVRAFLAARGITLPEGTPGDPPEAETVCGVGRRKNDLVQGLIARDGVATCEGSVRFLAATREAGLACALVTSSENAAAVLGAAGRAGAFGLAVGVDRLGQRHELRAAGADIVVDDLAELLSDR